MTGILRGHVFPTLDGRDEATRQDGKGRLSADASAGPIANDAARTAGGSSSVLPHHLAIFGLKGDCGFRVYGNAEFGQAGFAFFRCLLRPSLSSCGLLYGVG